METLGRPSSYTVEIGDAICDRLCDGESLRAICDSEDMPSRGAVFRWLSKATLDGASEEMIAFHNQYVRAREEQADAIFDDVLSIADDGRNDYIEDGEGAVRNNPENIQRSRLRVDTRKWVAGKLRPKKYGEKIDHTSSDGSMTPKGLTIEATMTPQEAQAAYEDTLNSDT